MKKQPKNNHKIPKRTARSKYTREDNRSLSKFFSGTIGSDGIDLAPDGSIWVSRQKFIQLVEQFLAIRDAAIAPLHCLLNRMLILRKNISIAIQLLLKSLTTA